MKFVFFIIFATAIALSSTSPIEAQSVGDDSTIRVLVLADFPPQFVSTPEGPSGLAVEMMREVARRASLKIEFVTVNSWPEVYPLIKTRSVDVISNMGVSEGRKKILEFTDPYEVFGIKLFVRAETTDIETFDDLKGRKLGLMATNVLTKGLVQSGKYNTKTYKSFQAVLLALLAGEIDALPAPTEPFLLIARSARLDVRIQAVGPSLLEVKRAIAVPKGRTDLRDLLNSGLREFKRTGGYQALLTKWYGAPTPYWTTAKIAILMGALLLCTIFVMASWRYHSVVKLNRRIKRNEEKLSHHILNTPLGCISWDRNFICTEWNKSAESIFRYSSDEAIGHHASEIIVPAEIRDDINKLYQSLLKQTVGSQSANKNITKDGKLIICDWYNTPILNSDGEVIGVTSLVQDITERKRAEDRFKALFEQSGSMCMILDPNTPDGAPIIVDANKAAYEAHGYTREEFIGRSIAEVGDKEGKLLVRERTQQMLDGGALNVENIHIRKDGTKFPVEVSAFRFDIEGEQPLIFTTEQNITERVKAEERFQAVTQSVNDAIISIDQDGKVILWNRSAKRIFGFSEAEMLGKPVTKIIPERYRKRHTEGIKHFNDTSHSALKDKTTELVGLRKDGSEISVELSLSTWKTEVSNNYVGVIRDITERKRGEDQLHKLSNAVEQSPASVIITDPEGIIEYVNPKFTEITGYSSEEAIGQSPNLLKSEETPDSDYKDLWTTIKSGKEWRGTLKNKRKDGSTYISGASISPMLNSSGDVTHFIGTTQDITEKIEYEQRLRQADKIESLGGLAGGIAHDINNMLLPILSLSEMVHKDIPEDSRNRIRLEKVMQAAVHTKELVAKILTFSRQDDAVPENVNIHACISEAIELLHSTLPSTVKFTESLDDAGTVFADRSQISSVLLNLASNSVDAMDGKTGELSVSLSSVKVGKAKAASIIELYEGNFAKLTVKDDGHGMDQSTLVRVMDPFFTTKEVGEGTGLGLAMIHGIVSRHKGAIKIISAPGKGTTIEIYLPLVEIEANQESRDGNDETGNAPKSARSLRQKEADIESQAHKH